MEDGFLRRGMATFTFDGPGQGETWFQGGMIVDFERATSAVIDYVEKIVSSGHKKAWRFWAEPGRLSRATIGGLRFAHQSLHFRWRYVRPDAGGEPLGRSIRIRPHRSHLEGI